MQLRLLTVLLLSIALNTIGQSQSPKDDPGLPRAIKLRAQSSTFLYCTTASTVSGSLKVRPGNNMTWKGNASLEWVLDVPKDEQYDLYLIANVRKSGSGIGLTFTANAQPTCSTTATPTRHQIMRISMRVQVRTATALTFQMNVNEIAMKTGCTTPVM